MDTARDLARNDPWQASAERSRARRGSPRPQLPRSEPARRRTERGGDERWVERLSSLQAWCERAGASVRGSVPSLGPRSVGALALLAAIVASTLAGGGQGSPANARADVAHAAPSHPGPLLTSSGVGAAGSAGWSACPLAVAPQGYVNPLAGATVKPERIDQGVDYAGSGTLVAIGNGRITDLAASNSGWPGAFIEYQLLDGADAGCYVYYAEGVIPAAGLAVGQTVSAGQSLATIIPKWPTGIELGWGAGTATKAYAKVAGQWSPTDDEDNVATSAGQSFSGLIAALGGPPGKVEG